MAAADIICLRTGIMLSQDRDTLFLSESRLLHQDFSSSQSEVENSSSQWPGLRGDGQYGDVILYEHS